MWNTAYVYPIGLVVIPLVIGFLVKQKQAKLAKVIAICLAILLLFSIFPMFYFQSKLVSVTDLFFQVTFFWGLMLLSYLLSFTLIALNRNLIYRKISLILFISGFTFCCIAAVITNDLYTNFGELKEISQVWALLTFMWLLIYFVLPMIISLFFLFLLAPKKEWHEQEVTSSYIGIKNKWFKIIFLTSLAVIIIFMSLTLKTPGVIDNIGALILLLLFWKLVEAFIINGVTIDAASHQITFHYTFGSKTIKNTNIQNWRINEIRSPSFASGGAPSLKYFECTLKNGGTFSYMLLMNQIKPLRLNSFIDSFKQALLVEPLLPETTSNIFSIKANKLFLLGLLY